MILTNDIQSPESYGHDLLHAKVKGQSVQMQEWIKRMDGGNCITELANAVENKTFLLKNVSIVAVSMSTLAYHSPI